MTIDLRITLWIAVAMLGFAELLGTTGIIPPPHARYVFALTSPHAAVVLGGLASTFCALYFFSRPRWHEALCVLAGSALILGAYLLWRPQEAGRSLDDLQDLYSGALALSALAALAVRARQAPQQRLLAGTLTIAFILILGCGAFADALLRLTAALHPSTYDATAFNIDATLGFQPSVALPLIVHHWPWLLSAASIAYNTLPWGYAALYGLQLASPRRAPVSILLVFAVSGAAALFLYHACPIAGPRYAFGDQYFAWWSGTLSNAPIPVEPAPRNGMPSMHFGWAMLLWMNAIFLGPWTRALFSLFCALTAVATLGLGQHYLVDLVAAVPFVVGMQALCALGLGWRHRHRLRALVVGFALTLAWIGAVRYGAVWFQSVPGLAWVAMVGTLVASVWVYRPLARALRESPPGVLQPVAVASPREPFPNATPTIARWGALIVPLIVGVIYWPAQQNGFIWDDWLPLVDSPVFRDPARWWEALWSPPLNVPVAIRPVAMLTFMLQLWAGQTTPAPFHVANVLIHAANAFVLALLAQRILAEATTRRTAAVSAVLCGLTYGLHPALTESVVWISCRYDLLMTFFLLLALWLDRALPQPGSGRAVAVGAAFLAAALSKETAVGFVLALPFLHIALAQLRGAPAFRGAAIGVLSAHWRVYLALFCAGMLYLVTRAVISGTSLGMERMAAQFHDVVGTSQRTLAVAGSLGRLAVDAAWPFKTAIPSRSLLLPLGWRDALPFVAVLSGGLLAAVLAVRGGKAGRAQWALSLGFVAALLPVINLFPLPGIYGELWVASRYLTFPLVFLCLAAPFAMCAIEQGMARHVPRARTLLLVVAVAWIGASGALVRVTIPLWKDDGTMNAWAIENGARSYWRYQNLGDFYIKNGRPELARKAFANAVEQRGDIAKNWYYLGFAEATLGHATPAREALRNALELDPALLKARLTLARLELGQGNPALAAEWLEKGSNRLDQSEDRDQIGTYHYLLGISYAKLGKREAAAAHLKTALDQAQDAAERRAAEAALRSIAPGGK